MWQLKELPHVSLSLSQENLHADQHVFTVEELLLEDLTKR